MANEQPPNAATGNIFSLIAALLFQVRHSLEESEKVGRPPRWIRVVRGAPEKNGKLGTLVSAAVDGIAETISLIAELTLKIEEMLYQADAAKAIGQVVLRMVQEVSKDDFQAGVSKLLNPGAFNNVKPTLDAIGGIAGEAEGYLKYIPEPEDVHSLGHELYRLLCIVQVPMPRDSDNQIKTSDPELRGTKHVVQESTGKVRLMAWAYGHDIDTHGLGADRAGEKPLAKLGSRRLFLTSSRNDLPGRSTMTWTKDDTTVPVFDFAYGGDEDVKELVELLQQHGYNTPPMQAQSGTLTNDIRANLMRFQFINELPLTGELDDHTLNRLLHLDFARKNLRRVKRFTEVQVPWPNLPQRQLSGPIPMVNAGADEPGELEIVKRADSKYQYYRIPVPLGAGEGNGWITNEVRGVGFVALQSRERIIDGPADAGRFDGAIWSEGESAHGRYFFAARHVEPWRAGRNGPPGPGALDSNLSELPANSRPRMYQWITLPNWLQPPIPGWQLSIYATVLQRSLYKNRGPSALPDQGRILIEFYPGTDRRPEARLTNLLAKTEWFPDHGMTTAALSLPEVDRQRLWVLRKTSVVRVPPEVGTLCLIAEGSHQAGWDTDAYFDDFEIYYSWNPPSAS